MENGKNRVSESNIVHWRSPWKPDDPIKRILCREFRPRIIVPRAAARVPARARPAEIMASSWKCSTHGNDACCYFMGAEYRADGREGGRGRGGGPLVKPICTSDALSIPRTADNFTGLYLRCLEPKGGEGRRSAYPNSFTYFPLSRKYIRVLSLLSPPSPPLVSWLFHFFSLFLSFFFFFGFSITIAVTFSEFFSTFSLSSFRFLEIGIYRSILCEVCEFFFYYFCLFETRYFKFVKFISNR